MATETTEITVSSPSIPPPRAGGSADLVSTDKMYRTIAQTITALSKVYCDGYSDGNGDVLTPTLQAYSTKKFYPDTEIEMLQSNALPMSENDIKIFREVVARRNSVQFRKEQMKLPAKTLAEITGSRVRAAYRLARYMTHVRGIGGIGQPLIFSMASANSQINLLELPMPFNPAVGWYRGLAAVRNLLAEISSQDTAQGNYTYTYNIGGEIYISCGLSILPPPIHDGYFSTDDTSTPAWEYRRQNYTPPGYSPLSDGPLNTYLNIMELLVRHLNMGEDDLDEQAAVMALLNPKIARLAWPCRDDIETFEEYVLIPHVNKKIIEKSRVAALEDIKKEMNLTHAEAFDFIETAITYSEKAFTYEPGRERATMINKLQKLAGECNEAGMVTTELNSYKTILQILGLTRHEEDANIDKREALSSALEASILEKKGTFLPEETQ